MTREQGQGNREQEMREKVIEGLESIHAVAVGDGEFYCTDCGMWEFNQLLGEAVALLKQENAISIAWLQNRVRMYLAVRDESNLFVASVLIDTIKAWRKEQALEREARTHAETPEAVE